MIAQMSAAATADILVTRPLLYYLKKSKAGTHRLRYLHYGYSSVRAIINRYSWNNSLISRLIVLMADTALLTG